MVHQIKDVRNEADATLAALKTILRRLAVITERRRAVVNMVATVGDIECCIRCGCLCLPDEHCPGCRARWVAHRAGGRRATASTAAGAR